MHYVKNVCVIEGAIKDHFEFQSNSLLIYSLENVKANIFI